MDSITIRPPREDELDTLARLRWQWVLENGDTPTTSRGEFVEAFVQWAARNTSSHRPMIMLRGREVIGMAWLAILQRVPTPRATERSSGDVQSMYVVPAERHRGHGGRLIDAIMKTAHELGLERVTVHSSERAIPAYERHGFNASDRLLQAHVELSPH